MFGAPQTFVEVASVLASSTSTMLYDLFNKKLA